MWISIKDKLPIEGRPVVVGNKYGSKIAFYLNGEWYLGINQNADMKVSYWFYVP